MWTSEEVIWLTSHNTLPSKVAYWFSHEFERYLQAKFHRNIDFQKQFDAWYKTGQVSMDYTKFMTEYLGV